MSNPASSDVKSRTVIAELSESVPLSNSLPMAEVIVPMSQQTHARGAKMARRLWAAKASTPAKLSASETDDKIRRAVLSRPRTRPPKTAMTAQPSRPANGSRHRPAIMND